MKLKKAKVNTPALKAPKFVYQEYLDMRKMAKVPVTAQVIEDMAMNMRNIADNKETIRVSQVHLPFGMIREEYERLCDKNDIMKQAHKYVMQKIAEHREVGAANFKLNWAVINNTQAHYCHIAKEQAEIRSQLRQPEDIISKQNIIVQMAPFETQLTEKK